MPALIPVPKTFIDEGPDKLDPLKSKVADEIIWKTRESMIDVLAGYTPQRLLPLYVRNTLMEKNGTHCTDVCLMIVIDISTLVLSVISMQ